jgi:hypothetical protein
MSDDIIIKTTLVILNSDSFGARQCIKWIPMPVCPTVNIESTIQVRIRCVRNAEQKKAKEVSSGEAVIIIK